MIRLEDGLDNLVRYVKEVGAERPHPVAAAAQDRLAFREIATMGGAPQVRVMAVSHDGRLVATGGFDGAIRVYDEPIVALKAHRKPVTSVAFLPDGRHVLTCAMDAQVLIHSVEAGTIALRLQGAAGETFAGAAIVGGGERLAAALTHGRVRLWQAT